jgi:nucleoside phosphorylase
MDIRDVKDRVDFGILTIREDEFRAVLRRFPLKHGDGVARGLRMYNLRSLDLDSRSGYTVAILRCIEQGNGEALAAARDLIEDVAPRWILVVGIAGAAPSHDITLGDVVISTRIIDFSVEALLKDGSFEHAVAGGPVHHDAAILASNLPAIEEELGAWSGPQSIIASRPPVDLAPDGFYGDDDWKKRVRRSLQHHFGGAPRAPRFTAGALAVSDRLVKDAERAQAWLRAARQFLAIEMESGGVHRATYPRNIPFPGHPRHQRCRGLRPRSGVGRIRLPLRRRLRSCLPLDAADRAADSATEPWSPGGCPDRRHRVHR